MKKKIGTIEVTRELTLKDFTWFLKRIVFETDTRKLFLDVTMWEAHYKHIRSFEFTLPESVENFSQKDAMNLLLQLPQFKDSEDL